MALLAGALGSPWRRSPAGSPAGSPLGSPAGSLPGSPRGSPQRSRVQRDVISETADASCLVGAVQNVSRPVWRVLEQAVRFGATTVDALRVALGSTSVDDDDIGDACLETFLSLRLPVIPLTKGDSVRIFVDDEWLGARVTNARGGVVMAEVGARGTMRVDALEAIYVCRPASGVWARSSRAISLTHPRPNEGAVAEAERIKALCVDEARY